MKTNASFIYLTATNHLVSAFTRNGALDQKLDEEQLRELLAKDLRLRHVRHPGLTFSTPPVGEIAQIQFRVPAIELSVLNKTVDDPFKVGAITRPFNYQVDGDVVKNVATTDSEVKILFENIKYEVKSDGVSVTLKPPGGKSLGVKPIKFWALLRLGPDGIFDSGSGEVPGKTANDDVSTGTISFASIPSGTDKTHQLLLMIEGIHPIWNEFDTGHGDSTWPKPP